MEEFVVEVRFKAETDETNARIERQLIRLLEYRGLPGVEFEGGFVNCEVMERKEK